MVTRIGNDSGIYGSVFGIINGGQFNQLNQLRFADTQIRNKVQAEIASAPKDASTTINYKYAAGPDGKLYAVDATITTTRKIRGPRSPLGKDDAFNNDSGRSALNPNYFAGNGQKFSDLYSPRLGLSPADQAIIFGQEVGEAVANARLRASDTGVRTHEGLHLKSSGGLAVGLPEFDLVQGPDGGFYAIGGKVDLQTTSTSDPIKAARQARDFANAAQAPGDASAQDIGVAQRALSNVAGLYVATGNHNTILGNNVIDFAA